MPTTIARPRPLSLTSLLLALVTPSLAHADGTPGLVPLPEMTQPYGMDADPGLYPGGTNEPAGAHADYGDTRTLAVEPRLGDGSVTSDGWIGVLSIGLSNTNQEWSRFERDAELAGDAWGRVVLVDAAQGGVDAVRMQNGMDPYWGLVDGRVVASGLDPRQVQVVWIKQSLQGEQGSFPDDHRILANAILGIRDRLVERFENLQVIYLSSRVYGGYQAREPWAYGTAFSVKWAIEDQVDALAAMDPDPGPWLAWGPYLWANGDCPTQDGMTWVAADYEDGGTNVHLSLAGEQKVGNALRAFFNTDDRAQTWYGRRDGVTQAVIEAEADAYTDHQDPGGRDGSSDRLVASAETEVYVRFPLDGYTEQDVLRADISWLADADLALRDMTLHSTADNTWQESTLDANGAPATGPALVDIPRYSRGAAPTADVTAAVRDALTAGASAITLVWKPAVGGGVGEAGAIFSRETGEGPRLLITSPDTTGETTSGSGESTGATASSGSSGDGETGTSVDASGGATESDSGASGASGSPDTSAEASGGNSETTGAPSTGGNSGASTAGDAGDSGDASEAGEGGSESTGDPSGTQAAGCGCQDSGTAGPLGALLPVLTLMRRRKRRL